MVSSLRPAVAVASAVAIVVLAATARAEPTAAEKETARGLMADGRARRDRGDPRGALESFRGADAIMHVPTTGLEVARTEVALGQLVEASDELRAVLRIPASSTDPAPFVAARTAAQSLLGELTPRIPAIRVTLTGAKDAMSVTIDDVAMPRETVGEPFKVDPGHHVVRASQAPGGAVTTREVDVAERETKVVAMDPPAAAPPSAAASVVAPAPAAPEEEVAPPPSDAPQEAAAPSRTMRTLAWSGVALAAAGVITGSVAGVISASHTSTAKGICNGNHCPPAAAGELDVAHSTATLSTASFVVAGAGAAIAVIGFVVGDPAPAPARAGRIEPWISVASAGARVSF